MNDDFPPELKKLLPSQYFTLIVEMKEFSTLLFGTFAAVMVYGPVAGPPDHNGYRYFLAPLLCPALGAIFPLLKPFNPYGKANEMPHLENSEPEARRLVALLRSKGARRYILKMAGKLSCVLYIFAIIVTILIPGPLDWSIRSPGLVPGFFGCCLGSCLWITTEYSYWGVMTWANQPTVQHDSVIIPLLILASPIAISTLATAPFVPNEFGRRTLLFIAWSLPTSFVSGAIIGARGGKKLRQIIRESLSHLALVTVGFSVFQVLAGRTEISFYIALIWGLVQVPSTILGSAIGAHFLAGGHAAREDKDR